MMSSTSGHKKHGTLSERARKSFIVDKNTLDCIWVGVFFNGR